MLRCGIDLIEVARVRAAIERHGEHFVRRVFTPAEIAYCSSRPHPWPHWAARFAAKEALFKALPAGAVPSLVWREMGVCRDDAGQPEIELLGDTKAHLAGWRFAVSLSHVRQLAVAQVLARPPRRD